jgi:hypothetical protein
MREIVTGVSIVAVGVALAIAVLGALDDGSFVVTAAVALAILLVAGFIAGDGRTGWLPLIAAVGYIVLLTIEHGVGGAVDGTGDTTVVIIAPFLLGMGALGGLAVAAGAKLRALAGGQRHDPLAT